VSDKPLVHVTVAGSEGSAAESDLIETLREAIEAARDPRIQVRIDSYTQAKFNMTANVLLDPAYSWEIVESDFRAALLAEYSFESRAFGQSISAAELMELIHGIDGVVAMDLDELYRVDESDDPIGKMLAPVLKARLARAESGGIFPAELLLTADSRITLKEMEP